jgi:FtsH-binding integral membrane protein
MRKVYWYLFIGIAAIALMTVIVFSFDPNTETWGSLLLGAAFGYLFVRMIKNRRQKNVK